MSRLKTIVSGLSWSLLNDVVKIIVGFVSLPISLQYFGKETYGLIAMANSINVYLSLLDMGMTNTNVRFFSEYIACGDREREQKLIRFTSFFYLMIGLINTIILFICAFFVQDFFKVTPEQVVVLRHLVLILALNSTFSWFSACMDQYLTAYELIDWLKKRSLVLRLLSFAALLLTVVFHLHIEFYYFCSIFAISLILPLSICKAKRISSHIKISPKFDKDMYKIVLPYALTIFSFSIFYFLAYNSRSILLGNMCGSGTVAEFSIIITILSVVMMLTSGFTQVLLPVVTKMRVNNEVESLDMVANSGTKILCILLSFVVFGLVLDIDDILIVYVGEDYLYLSKWLNFALLTLLLMHRNVMTALVYTEKKLKTVSIMGFLAMCVAFALYFIFIPKYGLGGVFVGWLGHELVHTLFYYVYFIPSKLQINAISVFLKSVLPVWLVFALVCILVIYLGRYLSMTPLLRGVFKGIIYTFISMPIIWLFLLSDRERSLLLKQVKPIKRQ